MRVAVIVPVLNEVKMLPAFLERARDWPVDELVFVDGGSRDATPRLLAEAGARWMTSRAGRAIQMNAGARATKSDILVFIHADTAISSSNFEAIRRVMRDERVVGGRFDVRLSGRQPAFRVIEFFINLRSRLTRIATGDQAIFVRRSVFERLGGFPEQPLMEDVEFSRRLKRLGRIACLRERVVTSSRRWERHGIARTVWLMWSLRLGYWLGADPERLRRRYRDCS